MVYNYDRDGFVEIFALISSIISCFAFFASTDILVFLEHVCAHNCGLTYSVLCAHTQVRYRPPRYETAGTNLLFVPRWDIKLSLHCLVDIRLLTPADY